MIRASVLRRAQPASLVAEASLKSAGVSAQGDAALFSIGLKRPWIIVPPMSSGR